MPKIDFNTIEDAEDFSPLPEGKYACRVAEVEEARTKGGDEMWKLRLEVVEGAHAGRIIFDNLVFSAAAMKRVKLICSRLGLDVSGEVDLTPDMIKGRPCRITVETEEYEDHEGRRRKRNVVPFAGYERAAGGAQDPAATEEGGRQEDDGEGQLPF